MHTKNSGKVIIRAFPILSFHSLHLEFSSHNGTLTKTVASICSKKWIWQLNGSIKN